MAIKHLLVIDDEADIGTLLCEVAEGLGYVAFATANADEFWARYGSIEPDVIVLDLKMPGVDGVELLRHLAERKSSAQIVVMSGADGRVLQAAQRLGGDRGLLMLGVLQKPVRIADVRELLSRVAEQLVPIDEAALRQAIEAGEIVNHYQPKVDLSAGRPCRYTGCEALARWDHPGRGLLSPNWFIPLAEDTGLISLLTDSVLRQTVEQLTRWQQHGIVMGAAVNLSPQLLGDIDLPDRCYECCRGAGLEPTRLTFEITESSAMSDVTMTMDILTRFRLKGFGLSLDDFGTGYSSLVQLHRMPFNEMKIDKSFVIESDTNEEAEKIIRSIATLARSLGLSLCAEGVETERALALVTEVGCATAQGYLISRPMDASQIREMIGAIASKDK